MSDKQGNVYKGIAVLPAPDVSFNEMSTVTGNFDQPLTVKHRQALLLCRFIGEVLSGSLPKKIEVKSNGPTLRVYLKKFTKDWHGGSGYKGRVGFGIFRLSNIFSNATIARNSLIELRNSLIDLYKLENMAETNA